MYTNRETPANPLAPSPPQQSVQFLKGAGPARTKLLAKLGIVAIGDLIFHFPRSYDDLTDVRTLDNLKPNELQTIEGEVVEIEGNELPTGRRVTTVVIADAKG